MMEIDPKQPASPTLELVALPLTEEGKPAGDYLFLCATLPADALAARRPAPRMSVWVIDVSGSMAPSMQTLNSVLGEAYAQACDPKPLVIAFQSRAYEYAPPKNGSVFLLAAGGGTSFANAFAELIAVVGRRPIVEGGGDVLFFTDGCDSEGFFQQGRDGRKTASPFVRDALWPFLRQRSLSLHVVGYGINHDLDGMAALVSGREGQDSYMYAPDETALQNTVRTFQRLSTTAVAEFSLTLQRLGAESSSGPATPLRFQTGDEDPCVVPLAGADLEAARTGRLLARLDGGLFRPLSAPRTATTAEASALLRERVRRLASAACAGPPDLEELKACDRLVATLKELSFGARSRGERKAAMVGIEDVHETIATLFRAAKGAVDVQTRAALLACGSAIRTGKRGLDKRLDQRILENGDLPATIERDANASADLLSGGAPQPPPNARDLECPLTTLNWWEAALDGDAMCVALTVERPAASVAEPALVHVVDVQAHCMTFSAFKDAYRLGLLRAHGHEEALHGGFGTGASASRSEDGSRASVLRDRVLPRCNAVLPLFVSPEHWSVARHWMKAALGWIAALDERAYSHAQWTTLPYLVLEWMGSVDVGDVRRTERFARFEALLRDTCRALQTSEARGARCRAWLELSLPPATVRREGYAATRRELPNLRLLCGVWRSLEAETAAELQPLANAALPYLQLEALRRAARLPRPAAPTSEPPISGLSRIAALCGMAPIALFAFEANLGTVPMTPEQAQRFAESLAAAAPSALGPAQASATRDAHALRRALSSSSVQAPATPCAAATLAHALVHCDSEEPQLPSTDSSDAALDPVARPLEIVERCLCDAWDSEMAALQTRFQKTLEASTIGLFLRSEDVPWPYAKPHFYTAPFGRMLKKLRSLRGAPGSVANAAAKLADFRALGWRPSARNASAFLVHQL
ncbi:Hypothetical protein UVM_LOCUS67 [uncultured virus]|nr:Hypothetical protein UVM_LOCUS67 [uncultured virus]